MPLIVICIVIYYYRTLYRPDVQGKKSNALIRNLAPRYTPQQQQQISFTKNENIYF